MVSIDVHDLPEPIAQAIAAMVDTIRIRVSQSKPGPQLPNRPDKLPLWSGRCWGNKPSELPMPPFEDTLQI
jgi:hypothetical protein